MGKKRKSKSNSRRGFTLVEIMVVVIVIGVVCAAILPNLGGSVGARRVEAATQEVAALLDYAYNAAATTGRVYGLIFSREGRHFEIVALRPPEERPAEEQIPGEQPEPQFEPVSIPGLVNRDLPEEVVLKETMALDERLFRGLEGETRVLFFPDGTTEFATLIFEDVSGDRRGIEINGLSGAINIFNPAVEQPAPSVQVLEVEEPLQ